MVSDSLVSINITNKDRLLNPTKTPILYYWDGNSSEELRDHLMHNVELIDVLKQKIMTKSDYENGSVDYFYFVLENDEEKYEENSILFQEIISLSSLNSDVWLDYIIPMFNYLYKCAAKKDYVFDYKVDIKEQIIDIYRVIYNKYLNKITVTTVVKYVLSELNKQNSLTDENKMFIVDNLQTMLSSIDGNTEGLFE